MLRCTIPRHTYIGHTNLAHRARFSLFTPMASSRCSINFAVSVRGDQALHCTEMLWLREENIFHSQLFCLLICSNSPAVKRGDVGLVGGVERQGLCGACWVWGHAAGWGQLLSPGMERRSCALGLGWRLMDAAQGVTQEHSHMNMARCLLHAEPRIPPTILRYYTYCQLLSDIVIALSNYYTSQIFLKCFLFSFHQTVVGDVFQAFLGRVGKGKFHLEVSHISSSSTYITEPKYLGWNSHAMLN